MGYLTLRNIHIETGNHSPRDISLAFCKQFNSNDLGVYSYISPLKTSGGKLDFDGIAPRSWYREREDMCAFSKLFPSAVFTVHGIGEDPEDIWQNRYQAGQFKHREMIWQWSKWHVA